jgi:hypothetical protein
LGHTERSRFPFGINSRCSQPLGDSYARNKIVQDSGGEDRKGVFRGPRAIACQPLGTVPAISPERERGWL